MGVPVYLEVGSKKVFACAMDWPGWCRSAKTAEGALDALAAYAGRYRPVADEAGLRFPRSAGDQFYVVERVAGSTTTDFGAPDKTVPGDFERLTKSNAERLAALVGASWRVFERVVAGAPAELRKGPRGGGRDRDKVVDHVVGSEAGYFRMVGLKTNDRAQFLDIVRAARAPEPELATKSWPYRYAARRVAWHALDHAWEIEDRSE